MTLPECSYSTQTTQALKPDACPLCKEGKRRFRSTFYTPAARKTEVLFFHNGTLGITPCEDQT